MPDFALRNVVDGRTVRRADASGHPLLVMFLSNECPFVQHVLPAITAIGRDYADSALRLIAINSNDDIAYPREHPALMKALADREGWHFPYLVDAEQGVARAFNAACTPEFFLYDDRGQLAYHGQLDDARPGRPVPVTGADLRAAIDVVLAGAEVVGNQKPAIGCVIKWRRDPEPSFATSSNAS